VAELQQQHIQALAALDQEYRAQLQQSSNPFTRGKVELEYRLKRSQLDRDHRERLRNTAR
jgi:hypothetical protein